MKHSFLKRVLWLLIPLLTLTIPNAWGVIVKDTITLEEFAGSKSTSYVTSDATGATSKGITTIMKNWTPYSTNKNQIRVNQGNTSSLSASNFYVYNSDAMPGVITKIELIVTTTSNAMTNNYCQVTGSSSSACNSNPSYNTGNAVSGTIGAGKSGTLTKTFNESNGYKYFRVSWAKQGGTVKVSHIIITYVYHTVTYNGNGNTSGTAPTDNTKYLYNAYVATAANSGNLEKTGYTFSGWNTKADGTGTTFAVSTSNAFRITQDTILHAKWDAASSYTITAASNNDTYGTVSLSGSVITAAPATCYEYASTAYTVSPSGKATVTQGTGANINKFTVSSVTADVTVTINFTPKASGRTVNFDAGPVTNPTALTEDCLGEGITLPSVTASGVCKGWTTFAGWTTSPVDSSATSVSPLYTAGSKFTPSSDGQTLYAVYSKNKAGSGFSSYTKVTSAPSDWSGKYLISDGTNTATGSQFSSTALAITTLTPGTTEYTSYEFTITKNGNNNNYYIVSPDGTYYVGYSGSSAGLAFSTSTPSTNAYLWTCNTSDPMTLNVGTNTRYIGVGSESNTSVFKAYSTSGTNAKCYLYKRIEGGSTTYYCSDPDCCNPLGSINGSFMRT